MSSYYQFLDQGHFDYDLKEIPAIPEMLFRGPALDSKRPYVACVGAAQTFGRFCATPFPMLLSDRLDFQFANLGVGGVGTQFFDKPIYIDYLNRAELVIVQVLSGRSEGNSLFDNSMSGGLVGRRIEDQREMRFEDFIIDLMNSRSPEFVTAILEETRDNYVRRFSDLLVKLRPPTIIFWFSTRPPDYREDFSSPWTVLGEFPQLINRRVIDAVRTRSTSYVECISRTGLPQILWEADQAIDGTNLEGGRLVNRYYPSPQMHEEAAAALEPVCRALLNRKG